MTPTPMTPQSDFPSGLTVDGIRIPITIEAAGGDAIAAYVLEQLATPADASAQAVPSDDEGDAS